MDNNFCTFRLAPVTGNILGYSLFWDRIQNGFLFGRWNLSSKWSSCTIKYQERDKIWLVGVYWAVDKKFLLICNKIIKKWSLKHCQLKSKQTLNWVMSFIYKKFFIFIQLIWLILKQLSASGLVHSTRYMYLDALHFSIYPLLFTSNSGGSCILSKHIFQDNISLVFMTHCPILKGKWVCSTIFLGFCAFWVGKN